MNLLLNNIKNKTEDYISFIIDKKIIILKEEISDLRKDQKVKNTKIDDLNKKISFYEKENKNISKDIFTMSNAVKDLYISIELIATALESTVANNYEDEYDYDNLKNKKKLIH